MKLQVILLIIAVLSFGQSFQSQETNQTEIMDSLSDPLNFLEKFREIIAAQGSNENMLSLLFSHLKKLIQENNENQNGHYNEPSTAKCIACKVAIKQVNKKVDLGEQVEEKIIDFATQVCIHFNIAPEKICKGSVTQYTPYITKSLWQHYTDPNVLCPFLKLCKPVYERVDIDEKIKQIVQDKPNKEKLVPKGNNPLKMLLISDVHTDEHYSQDYTSKCEDTNCCRPGAGEIKDEKDKPQYWGTISNCDLPTRTFEQLVNYVKQYVPNISFGLWTGDNTSHNVWDQSFDQNLENTVQQSEILKKILPDIKFFPTNGNHESYPQDIYDFEGEREDQFNQILSNSWESWIGAEAAQMFREKKGFYESEIYDGKLKIIAMNTQSCYLNNWVNMRNPNDPGHQLELLQNSLQQSEAKDQAVYIIAHIPSGDGCYVTWAKIFEAIVDRYSYTIRGIFTSHTHFDQFELYYSQNGEPISINWISPSVTTFDYRNPEFRVYDIDSETFQILNVHTYRLDLNYWNQIVDPNVQLMWERSYDYVTEYDLKNTWDPASLQNLREQIGSDLNVYNKYLNNFYSGVYQEQSEIDKLYECMIEPNSEKRAKCMGKKYIPQIPEIFAGPWMQKISHT